MLHTYRYRVEVTGSHGIAEKLAHLVHSFRRAFTDRKTVLFYPDEPMPFCVIYKILKFLGYRITTNYQENYNVAIKYWLGFDGNPFSPDKSFHSIIRNNKNGIRLLNSQCNDISKIHVNAVFEETFGYPLSIDPSKHVGKCVMKLNWNALHKGQVIDCPAELRSDEYVYQKLIDNETGDGLVKDMRVPIYRNKTPFVYLKYRALKDRFVDREHTNTKATIVEVPELLSEEELDNIHRFCSRIGMDYGEVDVLRDRTDGRIYIVDANNAPSGPPSPITDEDARLAVVRLSRAFEEAFE